MLEVTILASGSAGNAALVRSEDTVLLVDAGLSGKQLCLRLEACGLTPDSLSGVLLTHEHGDHTSSLRVMLSRHRLPVYCNALTAHALREGSLGQHQEWRLFQNGADFTIGNIEVKAFSVPHDAADPVGFRLSSREASFGVLTDLGYATQLVFEMLRDVGGLLIETNHDEDLLQKDLKRPWSVKQRILSRHGHLSNAAAARVLAELESDRLQTVILGHLSRDCNTPELAVQSVRENLNQVGRGGVTVHCAGQEACSPRFAFP